MDSKKKNKIEDWHTGVSINEDQMILEQKGSFFGFLEDMWDNLTDEAKERLYDEYKNQLYSD